MGKFSDALMNEVKSYRETEWFGKLGSKEVTLSARPLTPADITTISRNHPNFLQSMSLEGMVDLIILKAHDATDGQKAFDRGDKPLLMKIETTRVGEIFQALFGSQLKEDDEEKFEERVKN